MMRNLLLFLYILPLYVMAQKDIKIRNDHALPQQLREISGAVFWDGLLWAHNDGGDEPVLYALDTSAFKIVKRVYLKQAVNTDWEDIAQDGHFIYIGDIGNNAGNRNYLQIYKIAKSDIKASGTKDSVSVLPQLITVSYKDKPAGILKKHRHNYDAEALAAYGGRLYIFSKNWLGGPSVVYAVDTAAGVYEPEPFCRLASDFLVTGADIRENELWVCGYYIDVKIDRIVAASFAWPPQPGQNVILRSMHSFSPSFRQLETIAAIPGGGFFMAFEQLQVGALGAGPGIFRFIP